MAGLLVRCASAVGVVTIICLLRLGVGCSNANETGDQLGTARARLTAGDSGAPSAPVTVSPSAAAAVDRSLVQCDKRFLPAQAGVDAGAPAPSADSGSAPDASDGGADAAAPAHDAVRFAVIPTGEIVPQSGDGAATPLADVFFSDAADKPFTIRDRASSVALHVTLLGTAGAAATVSDSALVYEHAAPGGGHVFHRPSLGGDEDFVEIASRASGSSVGYDIELENVAGVRFIDGAVEFLDSAGTPRMHVVAPSVRDTTCRSVQPQVALSGCAYSTDPSPPWNRPVTAPGASRCHLEISWDPNSVTYPVVVDPAWVSASTMPTTVDNAAAARLPTGDVLVTGGLLNGNTSGSAQIYNVTTNTWALAASMADRRYSHTMTVLPNGKILVVAGGTYDGATYAWSSPTSEIYNPSTSAWESRLTTVTPRQGHRATLLQDGRVLVTGGDCGDALASCVSGYRKDAFIFDGTSWLSNGASGANLMTTPKFHHSATLLANGQVLLAGGYNSSQWLTAAELYTPGSGTVGTFASTDSLVTRRYAHGAVRGKNGKVYVLGGGNTGDVQSVEVYDPSVSAGSKWSSGGLLQMPRFAIHNTTFAWADDASTIFVSGGLRNGSPTTLSEIYNVTTGTSDYVDPFTNSAHAVHVALKVKGGRSLAAGGDGSLGGARTNIAEYWENCSSGCDDGLVCTTDACGTPGCSHTAVNCADSDPCTVDSCVEPTGCSHAPVDVNDSNDCTADACDSATGGITHTPLSDTSCTLSIAGCSGTTAGVCHAGVCSAPACKVVTCNKTTNALSVVNAPDGTSAPDSNPCNGVETCAGGIVQAGSATAAEGTPCTTSGACVAACDGAGACAALMTNQPPGCSSVSCTNGTLAPATPDGTCASSTTLANIGTRPNSSVPGSFASSVSFLYTGAGAIQTGADSSKFDPARTGVVRGRILQSNVQTNTVTPLQGVKVEILNHSEFGSTTTRSDGWYDLAVNGGESYVVHASLAGYETADRHATAAWHDFTVLGDVILTPKNAAQAISSTNRQVAFSFSPYESNNGATPTAHPRTAAVYIPNGTVVTGTLPGGGTWTAPSTFNVRITEFTQGTNGALAMPGELPPLSRYTYAAEFGISEADAAGVTSVDFSGNVSAYVTNFWGMPHGKRVPVGTYDATKAQWVSAEGDGQPAGSPRARMGDVIQYMGKDANGRAILDVTGDGKTQGQTFAQDTGTTLTALGIDDAELVAMASLFGTTSQSIWRVRLRHFSKKDFNDPYAVASDAIPPPDEKPSVGSTACQHNEIGSIIGCDNQTLGEVLPINGTPFTLHYQSERTASKPIRIDVPVTDSRTIPPSLAFITVNVTIAGQTIGASSQPANPFGPGSVVVPRSQFKKNLRVPFFWDRKDAYGQTVQGARTAWATIGYWYSPVPAEPGDFGGPSPTGATYGWAYVAGNNVLYRTTNLQVLSVDAAPFGLGQWGIDAVHMYDADSRTLIYGDGTISSGRVGTPLPARISTALSLTCANYQAINSTLAYPDGRLVVAIQGQVREQQADGTWLSIAGTGTPGISGTNGSLASTAQVSPIGLARGADGTIYLAEGTRIRALRKTDAWRIYDFAGGGTSHADGVLATQAQLYAANSVSMAPDGSVYFPEASGVADSSWNTCAASRIRRVALDGRVETTVGKLLSGSPPSCSSTLNGSTPQPGLGTLVAVGITTSYADANGDVYFAVSTGSIWRQRADGYVEYFAGAGLTGSMSEGGAASAARMGHVSALTRGLDGSLYYSDPDTGMVRGFRAGRVYSIAGQWNYVDSVGTLDHSADNGPAYNAKLVKPTGLSASADGSLIISNGNSGTNTCQGLTFGDVRLVKPAFPAWQLGNNQVPSPDGSEIYVFDNNGRHLQTLDAIHGAEILNVSYDSSGRVASINTPKDPPDGSYTAALTVSRSGTGTETVTLSSAHARTSTLTVTNGLLTNVNYPSGESYSLQYAGASPQSSGTLLTSLTDPFGTQHKFTYDQLGHGRLVGDTVVYVAGSDERTTSLEFYYAPDAQWATLRTTPTGRTLLRTIDRRPQLGDVAERQTTRADDGTLTTVDFKKDGSRTSTLPDGTVLSASMNADPRLGLSAPYSANVSVQNGTASTGFNVQASTTKSVTWSSPDPFTMTSWSRTTTPSGTAYNDVTGAGTLTVSSGPATNVALTGGTGTQPTLAWTRGSLYRSVVLDSTGRVTSLTSPGLFAVQLQYDAEGRPNSITQGTRTTAIAYDATTGFISSITQAGIATTINSRDGVGRPVSVTLPGSLPVNYGYDFAQRRFTVTTPGTKPDAATAEARSVHTFDFDKGGFLATYTAPSLGNTDPRATSISWNADRAPVLETLPSTTGRQVWTSYDSAGRISGLGHPGAGNAGPRSAQLAYDSAGRLQTISSYLTGTTPTSTTTLSYTSGVLTRIQYQNATPSFTKNIDYTYDGLLRARTRSIDGYPLTYAYDASTGLLATVSSATGTITLGRAPADGSGHTSGLLTSVSSGSASVNYSPDSYGDVTTLEAKYGTTSTYKVNLTRDSVGRIQSRQDIASGVETDRSYNYDAAGRLWQVFANLTNTGTPIATYTYDSNGNRTDITPFTYDAHDRQRTRGSVSSSYEYNGELASTTASSLTNSYTYDPQGQIVQVTLAGGPTTISYELDGVGRRVKRTNSFNNAIERYFWEGSRIVAVMSEDPNTHAITLLRRFVYITSPYTPDAVLEGSSTPVLYLLVKDERGSVRQVMRASDGVIAESYSYDEWGAQTSTEPANRISLFGYAGGVYDPTTKLVRFGARDYDPVIGRWTSKDPSRFTGGFNFFVYAGNDPMNFVDPTGNAPQWLLDLDDAGYIQPVGDFAAGFTSAVTFGLSDFIVSATGLDAYGSKCSGAYGAGEIGGVAFSLAAGAGAANTARVGGRVTLFRSVSQAEFDELIATGRFSAGPNSLGGKFFAETVEHAGQWGDALGNSRIVSATFERDVADQFMRWERLDGIGPARYAELNQLGSEIIGVIK